MTEDRKAEAVAFARAALLRDRWVRHLYQLTGSDDLGVACDAEADRRGVPFVEVARLEARKLSPEGELELFGGEFQ